MSPRDFIAALALIVATLTFLWGIIRWYSNRERAATDARLKEDRERVDQLERDLWKKVGLMQADLSTAQKDLAVLQTKVSALPDGEVLRERFESFEGKMERKLEGLGTTLQASMKMMADAMTAAVESAIKLSGSQRP